jgi:hypothetical protein
MKSLAASFLAMLFVDTIGAVDPFAGTPTYLPSPRSYLATFLLWGLLGLVAGFGDSAARLAGRTGAVVLLTAAVIGPFGRKAVGFVEGVATATSGGTS